MAKDEKEKKPEKSAKQKAAQIKFKNGIAAYKAYKAEKKKKGKIGKKNLKTFIKEAFGKKKK